MCCNGCNVQCNQNFRKHTQYTQYSSIKQSDTLKNVYSDLHPIEIVKMENSLEEMERRKRLIDEIKKEVCILTATLNISPAINQHSIPAFRVSPFQSKKRNWIKLKLIPKNRTPNIWDWKWKTKIYTGKLVCFWQCETLSISIIFIFPIFVPILELEENGSVRYSNDRLNRHIEMLKVNVEATCTSVHNVSDDYSAAAKKSMEMTQIWNKIVQDLPSEWVSFY